ncbi:MAG: hypothetical protein ACR2F6_06480 [Mycobacteriales bacterium]
MGWPKMIWIGGTQGAGKSTIARMLAHEHDLPLHRIDSFSYAHAERLPAVEPFDVTLRRGAGPAADAWDAHCRHRLPLILDDVAGRGLGDVPAIVEGPQLTPVLADSLRLPAGSAVWMLTTAARTRRVREQRLASLAEPAARSRLVGWPSARRSWAGDSAPHWLRPAGRGTP